MYFSVILRGQNSHSHAQSRIASWPFANIFQPHSKKQKQGVAKPVGFFYQHIRISYTLYNETWVSFKLRSDLEIPKSAKTI
jgi:hypothetical protein